MHPLDNVIWQALTTRDALFAESFGEARRFVREVGPLGAFRDDGPRGYASLAGLVEPDGTVGVFLDQPYESQTGWTFVAGAPLLQMVAENAASLRPEPRLDVLELLVLGAPDSREMIELTALTKPGPFGSRTHELGLTWAYGVKESLSPWRESGSRFRDIRRSAQSARIRGTLARATRGC